MSVRFRFLTVLLALVTHLAAPALVLCQELDGAVQLELRLGDCCEPGQTVLSSGAPDASVFSDASPAPDCACDQDVAFCGPAKRPNQPSEGDLAPPIAPPIAPAVACWPLPNRTSPAIQGRKPLQPSCAASSGSLACLQTVVLRN